MNMDEIAEVFREEAQERLDDVVKHLLALERGTPAADVIDSLFRDAHSIKGGAGMMGFDDAYGLAHVLEDALGEARRRSEVPPALIEPLLRASDVLREAVGGDTVNVEKASKALRAATGAAFGDGAPTDSAPPARADVDEPRADVDEAPAAAEPATRPSIRVDAAKVDRVLDAVGETVLHHNRLEYEFGGDGRNELLDEGEVLLDELQHAAVELRTVPLGSIAGRFSRGVREVAAAEHKEVDFVFEDSDAQVDRALLDGTADAITHVLRNAVAHGIELPEERERAGKPRAGRVALRAEARGDRVAIEVEDDGRGVSPDLVQTAEARELPLVDLLSEPGFSTAEEVSVLAGRGVGLDAVRSHVEAVGGSIDLASAPGRGTKVTLLLPVSVAVLQVLLVVRGEHVLGLPLAAVAEVTVADQTVSLGGRTALTIRGTAVPSADLLALLGADGPPLPDRAPALILGTRRPMAALCDYIRGEEEVIVKPLGRILSGLPGYLGAALLGDGSIALIVEPAHLLASFERPGAHAPAARPREHAGEQAGEPRRKSVLVVDDQFTVRELQRSILEAAGYEVQTARDGQEAWDLLQREGHPEVVITDVEMPNMDGLQLLEAIRRRPELAALPVVVVTSRGAAGDERRGLEAGADAYIVKERFDQQALLDTVQRLVGL